jgi:hypothetical protein
MHSLSIGHSALLTDIATCLNCYRLASPGLYCCVHVAVELPSRERVTPGVVLMVNHGRLKNASPEPEYEIFRGSPNFIADVFASPAEVEYQTRKRQFSDAGVGEYLAVFDTEPLTWHWHSSDVSGYGLLSADEDGVLRSKGLPGLWVPEKAFSNRDWWAIMASIARGVTRRGHHELMNTIWNPE